MTKIESAEQWGVQKKCNPLYFFRLLSEALKRKLLCGAGSVQIRENECLFPFFLLFSAPHPLYPHPLPLLQCPCLFVYGLAVCSSQLGRCTRKHYCELSLISFWNIIIAICLSQISVLTSISSFRLDPKTFRRTAFGYLPKRRNMKTMSSLPNSPWPFPRRRRVSVWLICILTVIIHVSSTSMFFPAAHFSRIVLSLLSPWQTASIWILLLFFHQLQKVRIVWTSRSFHFPPHLTILLCLEDAAHICICPEHPVKTISRISLCKSHPDVHANGILLSMTCARSDKFAL